MKQRRINVTLTIAALALTTLLILTTLPQSGTAAPTVASLSTNPKRINESADAQSDGIAYLPSQNSKLYAFSQWAATYGGGDFDYVGSMQETTDGGYVIVGSTYSFGAGDADLWILKIDSSGNIQWQKTYGGGSCDVAVSIQQTTDGGYTVAGNTDSFGAGRRDYWVLKLNSTGAIEWQKTYGGSWWDSANSIQQTDDGGYIVAGYTYSFGSGGDDIWILKLNSTGAIEWQKTYGSSAADGAGSIQQTNDGGYIVAGFTRSSGAGSSDYWVLKLNGTGAIEWQKTYGGIVQDSANSIQQTDDGGYIIAGGAVSFGVGSADCWLLKLNSNGTIEWQKTYGGTDTDYCGCIRQTTDGGYIVAGHTRSFGAGNVDFWSLKLNSNGSINWQKTYGGGVAFSIQQTDDGGYIVSGYTDSLGAGKRDYWVLKLDSSGDIDPSCSFIGSTSVSGQDTSATISDANITPADTTVIPSNTDATVTDTNVSRNLLCGAFPPTVVSASPEDGDTDVAVGTVITATFSEPMDSSTINTGSFTLAGSAVAGTVTYDLDTYTATFTPDANLDYDHEYTAALSTAITDEAGNPMSEAYSWSFTTQSDIAPPTCAIELCEQGTTSQIDEVDAGQFFDIYVGDSTDDTGIAEVRFSSDGSQDGVPTSEWTEWYDWDTSSGDWDATAKTKAWSFATGGEKEVWVEARDGSGKSSQCSANIFAHPGYAVIVAGRGRGLLRWIDARMIDHCTNNAYRALRNLGFTDDHIVYLNSRPQEIDGKAVVDYSANFSNFEGSLNGIKNEVGDNPTPLVLYLIGHGDKEIFLFAPPYEIPGYSLASHELRDMLSSFSSNRTLAIIASCYSGSFITLDFVTDSISVENTERIIITGCHDDEERKFVGLVRFTDRFFANLAEGFSVRDAFVRKAHPGDKEHLWLDDNGDTVGHPPDNLGDDGDLAAATNIGVPDIEDLDLTPWIFALKRSPGELRVYDLYDRVTGLVNGEVKEEIPNSVYNEQDDTVAIFSPTYAYRYQVVGTGEGAYGLELGSVEGADVTTFTAIDIPTSANATHQYTIDWDALSQGEEGVPVRVDSDGDGEFEHDFMADGELTRDEFLAGTTPSTPVGGVIIPVSRLELLAPWIGLASLILVVGILLVEGIEQP